MEEELLEYDIIDEYRDELFIESYINSHMEEK